MIAKNVFPSLGIDDVINIVLHLFSGTCAKIKSRFVLIMRIASAELERLFDLIISSLDSERGKSPKNGIETRDSISCLFLIFVKGFDLHNQKKYNAHIQFHEHYYY